MEEKLPGLWTTFFSPPAMVVEKIDALDDIQAPAANSCRDRLRLDNILLSAADYRVTAICEVA